MIRAFVEPRVLDWSFIRASVHAQSHGDASRPTRSGRSAGSPVVLDESVWRKKIVRDHPEVAQHRGDALNAVSSPDHVAPDPNFERRMRYYARGVGPSRWLLVVVSYEQEPARIISVFALRRDPKSWSA